MQTRQRPASPAATARHQHRPRLRPSSAAAGLRLAPAPRLVPPLSAPVASSGPSHAVSIGS